MSDFLGAIQADLMAYKLNHHLSEAHKHAERIATFPLKWVTNKPEHEELKKQFLDIVEKAKAFVAALDAARDNKKEAAAQAPASTPDDDTCSCAICDLRRQLTAPKTTVPTSSLDIILDLILGKAEAPKPAAKTGDGN